MRKTGFALAFAGWGALAAAAACGGSFNSIDSFDGGDATAGDGGGTGSEGGADVAKDGGGDAPDATQSDGSATETGPGTEASAETGGEAGDAGNTGDASDAGDAGNETGPGEAGFDAACPVTQVCEPAVPPGWQGPIDLVQGNSGAAPPGCPSSTALVFDASAGLDAGVAVCSTCGCSAPAGLACSIDVRMYEGTGCSNAQPCAAGSAGSTCAALSGSCPISAGGALLVQARTVLVAGACTASKEDPAVPGATWSTNVAGCAPGTAQQCNGGGACLPAGSRPCIYQSGTGSCPDAGYVSGHVFFEGLLDDRSCTSCGCGGADASCSAASVTVSPNTGCGLGITVAADGGCDLTGFVSLSTTPAIYAETDAAPIPSGGCPASGGQPTGGAAPSEPITVCCLP